MVIGIDARLWSQTGIGRYVRNLCLNLDKIDKKNEYMLFVLNSDEHDIRSQIKNKKFKFVNVNIRWHSISEQLKFPKVIEKENVDVMHFPYQQSVPIFYNKPFIITIHDLVRHHFITGKASTNPLWLYGFKMLAYKIFINSAARRAKKIIAVSNSTKREILDHLRVDSGKIEIIYEAADDFNNQKPQKIDIESYFLYVGNVYPHKNDDLLIKAFKKFSKNNNTKLVFAGNSDKFYKKLKKDNKNLIDEGKIIVFENASDEFLYSLYKNAICLVRPSLMEGFSLPPLEALQCRCLVLASNISTHKEIFADTIIYFNPYQIQDIIDKMGYAYKLDKKTKEDYIEKGLILAQGFSWESTARQTLKVYEDSTRLRSDK